MTDLSNQFGLGNPEPCSQTRPRLAVLIPVFNDHRGLEKSLASLAQDGAQFDVFVVDDGSEPPIAIPADLPYKVHLLRQDPNRGITAALNAGLAQIAEGGYEYVARLDACDLSLPGRFAAQSAFLDRHPECAVVGTAIRHVDPRGSYLFSFYPPRNHEDLVRFFCYRAGLIHPSVMMRLQALLACGFYRDKFRHAEDYDLFMRLGKEHRLANLETAFVEIAVRPNSISSKRHLMLVSRLRLLAWHFDPWSIHSYLGIVTNTLLLLAPRALVLKLRQLTTQWRDRAIRAF